MQHDKEGAKKSRKAWKYGFGIAVILLGAILNLTTAGQGEFLGFGTVGNWLVYVGFISMAIVTLQAMSSKKRVVDERMLHVAAKANRVTFLAVLILAFVIMIIDGLRPITMAYHMFMSYLVCYMMIVYFISYKAMLKYS
ncbi:DUF2178 domain-containing protein [Candidatus Woesearchaeota archaeon]|nr:DUF2178 domain-containing protein [Candidatus Woesearchaeota archaeon]